MGSSQWVLLRSDIVYTYTHFTLTNYRSWLANRGTVIISADLYSNSQTGIQRISDPEKTDSFHNRHHTALNRLLRVVLDFLTVETWSDGSCL